MSVITTTYGTNTALTVTGLNSLAAAGTAVSNAVANTAGADDYLIEAVIAPSTTVSGNFQVVVYAADSLDGTNYSDTTQLTNLRPIARLTLTGTGTYRMAAGSVAAAFGGVMPPYFKIALYNDAGVTLASTGNSVSYTPITFTST